MLLYMAYSRAETCELGHIRRLDPTGKVNATMVERAQTLNAAAAASWQANGERR